jgi:predicted lipoprotein with Yx(FWY)xxD motif
MVKSINLQKKEVKIILVFIISLLLFQSILPYIKADNLIDGPLEISTPQKSFNIFLGNSVTITWNFSVPSHEYAVYWEISGHGVNKNGWGLNANCTTPVVTVNGTIWIYNCSVYYAKYHVWSTVSVIGQEEVSGRNNDGTDGIYSQKDSSNGVNQWTANGTAICRASGDHKSPQIISDGAGGAIITWEVCTEIGTQKCPQLVSDGANGTIITWQDNRDGNYDIYAQKVNSSGDIQWIANGTAICTANGNQEIPQIVSDRAGGAIITWQDSRNGEKDIYSQKVNSSGEIQWIVNGTAICTANGDQLVPQLIGDGANGTIISWQDIRDGDYDIFAQKVNSSGYIQWTENGTAICTANGNQLVPQLIGDDVNGTIITWEDRRNGEKDIYAQKVNSNGEKQWTTYDKAICTANGHQSVPQLVSDGAGGAIITWVDNRVEEDGGDNNGDDNGDDNGNDNYRIVPGLSPFLFIIGLSICVIYKIIIFHLKSKKDKFQK